MSQYSFPGVTVTDTAYLRSRMIDCYHTMCDNLMLVTEDNIRFLVLVTEAVLGAVTELITEREVNIHEIDTDSAEEFHNDDVAKTLKNPQTESDNYLENSRKVYKYGNVGTQINIENLYLSVVDPFMTNGITGGDKPYFLINPASNKISNVIQSFFNSNFSDYNSPMILKLTTF